jgi:DinB superfamily
MYQAANEEVLMASSPPSLKSTVIGLLHHGRDDEKELLQELSSAERDREGSPGDPSAKVLLAHITEFKQQQVQKVAAAASRTLPPRLKALEPSDSAVYARLDAQSWQEVEADSERVGADLIREVERLSDDVLRDPHRFPWLNGRPLCRQVLGRGLWHPLTHLRGYYLQRGQETRWASLQQKLSAAVVRWEFVPERGDGMSSYNVGCAFAAVGESEKALALLQEAVRNDAKYADYARDDSDLATLRNEPGFETVLAPTSSS